MNTATRKQTGERANACLPFGKASHPLRRPVGCTPWRSLLCICLLLGATFSGVWADTGAPLFTGQAITYHGTVYTWDSATEDTDANDVTLHTDTYLDGGNAVTVQGRVSDTTLATVSGHAAGFIQSGEFYADGRYIARTGGATFTNHGVDYARGPGWDYYHLDAASWQLNFEHSSDTYYSYPDGLVSFSSNVDANANGTFSGGENGVVFDGTLYFNQSVTSSAYGISSYTLFGATYAIHGLTFFTYPDDTGHPVLGAVETYGGNNSGTLDILYRDVLNSSPSGGSFSGNDPVLGNFGGSYGDPGILIFDLNRTAPSLVPSHLWVNSTLVSWQPSRVLNADGDVADLYAGTDAEGHAIALTISGNAPAFSRESHYTLTAEVTVTEDGGTVLHHETGSYVKSEGGGAFHVEGWYVGVAQYSRNAPFYLPNHSSLWVNGTRYAFQGGIDDSAGNSVDTYANVIVGTLTLGGNSDVPEAVVRASYNGANFSGTFNADGSGAFSIAGLDVETSGPSAAAFWVNGSLYLRSETDPGTYVNPVGEPLSAGLSGGMVLLSGADAVSPFSGSCADGGGGIFLCTRSTGQWLPSCPANADGSLLLDSTNAPAEMPPAIEIAGDTWHFLGTSVAAGNPGEPLAYYANAASGGPGGSFLSIRLSNGILTLTDCAAQTSVTGTYSLATHLFQTNPGQLPMPMYGTAPAENNVRWGWHYPAAGRPSTVLAAGDVWGYTGTDGDGAAVYAGHYAGQQLRISNVAGRDGITAVQLTDPYRAGGSPFAGTFYNNSFQMASGSPAVTSGDLIGTAVAATGLNLSTTGADLDVVGNLFSLGSLANNPSTVGLTLQFSDNGTTAKLASSLSRPLAEWLWSHASASSPTAGVAMMKLGSGNSLTLFDPSDPTKTAILLNPNPAVGSRINGPLRIPPAGDLDMGAFTNGPKPDGSN